MVIAALPSSAKERDVTKACHKETEQPLSKFALYGPVSVCQSPWMSCPKLLLSMGLVCTCPGLSSIILAGTPRSSLPLSQIIDRACQEAEAYKDAGVVSFGFLLPVMATTQSHFCIARILN